MNKKNNKQKYKLDKEIIPTLSEKTESAPILPSKSTPNKTTDYE